MGEYPENKPVATRRMGKEAGPRSARSCRAEVSCIQFAQEFSVVKEIHHGRSDGGERYEEHHAEQDPFVQQRCEQIVKTMFDETDLACNIHNEDVIDDRKLAERFGLRRLGG